MDEDEDIFSGAFGPDEAETVKDKPAETPAPEPEPKATEQAPEPAQAEAPQPEPQPEPPAEPEPRHVPLTAMLDERDKRKALEAELAQLRAAQVQHQPEPEVLPDIFEDPEGYTRALNERFERNLYQQTLRVSERFARTQYGSETTDAALQWGHAQCAADPLFNAKVRQSDDPVGYVVQQYQRDQIASQVSPDEFAAFQAWKQAQTQVQAAPQAQPPGASPPIPAKTVPPRSLASAPSAGGVLDEPEPTEDDIFKGAFGKK